jgi:hypothetical protein
VGAVRLQVAGVALTSSEVTALKLVVAILAGQQPAVALASSEVITLKQDERREPARRNAAVALTSSDVITLKHGAGAESAGGDPVALLFGGDHVEA